MKTLTILVALACALPISAAQNSGQGQQQQQDPPKTEQKTAPSIAGKWTMTTVTQTGPIAANMELKLDGKKVTGTISSQTGDAAIAGEYAEGKLTFSITMQTNNGAIDIAFKGTLKENGALAGTLDTGSGTTLEWTAERVPESTASEDEPAAKPAAITGKWAVTLDISGVGPAAPTLELKQDGGKVTGTYTGRYGSFPLQGTLKGRALTFGFTMNADGTPVAMSFIGEVAADDQSISGTATMTGLGEATWTAKRQK